MSNASGDEEELKALLEDLLLEYFEYCDGVSKDRSEDYSGVQAKMAAVESLFGRIREAALTPEQRSAILDFYDTGNDFNPHLKPAIAKLRSISGGALKEGATQ